jgi:hypothetical protein
MKGLLLISIVFIVRVSVFAQDPGMPDSLIVDTVHVESGQPYADVDVFAVTDDNVAVYNIPITWSLEANGIEPSEVNYYYPLTTWDETYDSVIVDDHFLRLIGWTDLFGVYLNTNGLRRRCWQIRFLIDSLAPPQIVTIDTTYDPVNGSLYFGLEGGTVQLTPNFIPGAIYYGITSEIDYINRILPDETSLHQNYPNPFNASTTIEFSLPEAAHVELSVYNILGQKVAALLDGQKTAGKHAVSWDAGDMPSGVYFARIESDGDSRAVKMLVLK